MILWSCRAWQREWTGLDTCVLKRISPALSGAVEGFFEEPYFVKDTNGDFEEVVGAGAKATVIDRVGFGGEIPTDGGNDGNG